MEHSHSLAFNTLDPAVVQTLPAYCENAVSVNRHETMGVTGDKSLQEQISSYLSSSFNTNYNGSKDVSLLKWADNIKQS